MQHFMCLHHKVSYSFKNSKKKKYNSSVHLFVTPKEEEKSKILPKILYLKLQTFNDIPVTE